MEDPGQKSGKTLSHAKAACLMPCVHLSRIMNTQLGVIIFVIYGEFISLNWKKTGMLLHSVNYPGLR